MKKVFTLFTSVAIATTIFAQQPPNNGFESWPANNRNPTGWSTVESAANDAGFGLFITGKKFSNKETTAGNYVEGSTAVSVQSDSLTIPGQGTQVIPGILFLSKLIVSLSGFGFEGTPFTGKPDLIKFAYKYVPVGTDTANFFVALSKFNSLKDSSDFIAGAGEPLLPTGNNWDTLSLPIDYDPLYAGLNPDSLTIGFFSSGQAGQKGSKLWVDNVRLVYNNPNGVVEVPVETPTVNVFPNPANNVVNFKTDLNLENVVATIYSLEGRQVVSKTISNNLAEVNELASGRYFFTLHRDGKAVGVGNFSLVK
jgi:hypothetical protein